MSRSNVVLEPNDFYCPVWTHFFAFETFFKMYSLVFHRRKNTGWNGMRVSKRCQNVFLGKSQNPSTLRKAYRGRIVDEKCLGINTLYRHVQLKSGLLIYSKINTMQCNSSCVVIIPLLSLILFS